MRIKLFFLTALLLGGAALYTKYMEPKLEGRRPLKVSHAAESRINEGPLDREPLSKTPVVAQPSVKRPETKIPEDDMEPDADLEAKQRRDDEEKALHQFQHAPELATAGQ